MSDKPNTTASQNYAMIRLYSALEQVRKLINVEILPLASYTGLDKEEPLTEILDAAAGAINEHLSSYRLQATWIKPTNK